jgi:hypothetical protein
MSVRSSSGPRIRCCFLVRHGPKQERIELAKLWREIALSRSNSRRNRSIAQILAACIGYALLLVAFWLVALHFAMEDRIHGHMASSFTAFALLLAPYWFFVKHLL